MVSLSRLTKPSSPSIFLIMLFSNLSILTLLNILMPYILYMKFCAKYKFVTDGIFFISYYDRCVSYFD